MFAIPANLVKFPVNVDDFDVVIDAHSGLPICRHTYAIDAFSRSGRHKILFTNCILENPPLAYHDRDRILVIVGFAIYVVNLTASHQVTIIPIHYEPLRIDFIGNGYLVTHVDGCLLLSVDLVEVAWRVESQNIHEIVWRDGEIHLYFNEHTFILIDAQTGKRKKIGGTSFYPPKYQGSRFEDDSSNNVITLSHWSRRGR